MLDDADLLIRFFQDHSNEAFAELVSRHLNFVYSNALRQVAGDTHLAEDVAQSVFADLARKAKEISKCPVLARWLYTSTHHAAAKAVRSEQRRRAREKIAQAMHDISNDPANDTDWARIRPWLDEALRSLNRRDRDAILLRFFETRSFAAIGTNLGLNENAARMRVDRALEKLRTDLFRRGITSTTVAIAAALYNEALIAAPPGLVAAITDAALASTAGGSASTMTLFQFMSTTKLGSGAAAAIAAVAIGLTGYEFRAAHGNLAAFIDAQQQYDSKLQEFKDLHKLNIEAERRRVNLARSIEDLRAKRTVGDATVDEQAGSRGSSLATQKASVKTTPATNLKLRSDLEVWFKGLVSIQYGPFFKSTGMSPEQQARLLDLLSLQQTLALPSVVTSIRPESVSSDQIEQEIQDYLVTVNAEQQYQDYVRTVGLRPVTAVLAANLASTSTPLTADQGEQLIQILADNSPPGQPMNPLTVNWDAVLNQAQTVLSVPQMTVLKSEAVLVSLEGIPGTSFHPAGNIVGPGEDAPSYVLNPSGPGK